MHNLRANIIQTLKGFRARKSRTFLTMLGIIIGVAGVIIIVSLGAGAQQLIVGQVSKFGSNIVAVSPGKSNENGPPASVLGVRITTLTMHDVQALKDTGSVPHATYFAPLVRGSATVIAGRESVDTQFSATSGEYPLVQNIPISEGRFFSIDEGATGAQVVVLGSDVRTTLFGTGEALGKIIKVTRTDGIETTSVLLHVIGVAAPQGTVFFQNQDDQIYMPILVGQRQLLGISYLEYLRVKVDDVAYIDQTISDMESVLRREHNIRNAPEGDDFSVRSTAELIKVLSGITDGLRMFLGVMASVALVVGGIGIMNIMLVTVTERTREIGLRKAIGATGERIRNQFLLEAILLTVTGGIIGIVFGVIVSFLITIGVRYAGYDWAFIISPTAVSLALFVSVATGVVFGLYPAVKASKLNPIDALRKE